MVIFRPPAWTWLLWTEIPFSICSTRKGFAHRYRLRIKGLKWFTGLYQILSEFGHFKATWSVMYTFKDRYQSNPTAVHPPPTRPTCPESTSDQPGYIKLSSQFIKKAQLDRKWPIFRFDHSLTFLERFWFIWGFFEKMVPIYRKILKLRRIEIINTKWRHK